MRIITVSLRSYNAYENNNVVCLCRGCDGCCVSVCIVRRGAVGARVWGV